VPIYEYRCPHDHVFEVFQRIDDPIPERCEICGASPVARVLHPVAVHFKGSGFYATDYGRGSRRKAREAADSGGAGKSDSAPAKSDSSSD
jgi:putative FmdB family regulatory protein